MSPHQTNLFEDVRIKARRLKAQGKLKEALTLLEQARTDRPEDLNIKTSLADLYYRLHRLKEASRLAGEVLRHDPNDAAALIVMGNVLLKKKRPKPALEYFDLAHQNTPTDYTWLKIARCRIDLGSLKEALQALAQAEKLHAPTLNLLRLRAEIARLQNDSAAMRKILNQVAKQAPIAPKEFAQFVLDFLKSMSPRQAVLGSEAMRETPQQEQNPYLLLFEAQKLAQLKENEKALARIRKLDLLDKEPDIQTDLRRLKDKLGIQKS